jgi:predicted ATPase with chaperone activity
MDGYDVSDQERDNRTAMLSDGMAERLASRDDPTQVRAVRTREGEDRPVPAVPGDLDETGLSRPFVTDLLLKTLYSLGSMSGTELVRTIRLPWGILDDLLLELQQRHFLEVRGVQGHGRRGYQFDLTGEGRTRAREALDSNRYVGPAPVPGLVYRQWVRQQSLRSETITPAQIQKGFRHLVLSPDFVERIGPGINAGRSIFLYGPPGNGKTEVAYAISQILGSSLFIPIAVEVSGHIITLFDPYLHEVVDDGTGARTDDAAGPLISAGPEHDPRFVEIRRPAVIVGGELTLDDLELRYDSAGGVYSAPPQMKASGGVFVIDDFGRQRVRPRDLLNRWMIPLDKGIDYLGIPTGQKLEIPFDCLVVFSTNLNPADLVEEAFLRRIRYKLEMGDPTREQYGEIFRRVCVRNHIEYDPAAVDYIFQNYYEKEGISPRACHPGDVMSDLIDMAQFAGIAPELSHELVSEACRSYFIDLPKPGDANYSDMRSGGDRRGR